MTTGRTITNGTSGEIIYHIFQRSFYDSNGDGHGDLNGVKEKLDYLQSLGVTSILITPLYRSVYYHNYFADDFEKIDPSYGDLKDYIALVKAIHKKGMKFYMDMEIQYITEDHEWYKDSFENPGSPYSEYIVYRDKDNKDPESMIFNIKGQLGYDNVYKNITTVNLLSTKVQDYLYKLFSYWVDPDQNGTFEDGVDGFRLDHMMDTLDNKPSLSNLFAGFWQPFIARLKALNPDLIFIAEQTDWTSFGIDYLKQGAVDRVFAFPLRDAFLSFDKSHIATIADVSFGNCDYQQQQIVFIENHDIHRFATLVDNDMGKMRVGAALNLLVGGTPAIYYGQEIGMKGAGGFGRYGVSDGNDIPRREAFRWYEKVEGKGMALWYKDTGPWWQDSSLSSSDGISLEEQQEDPASLWNFYRELITIRKKYPALAEGDYISLDNNNPVVFSFTRHYKKEIVVVVINLSNADQYTEINIGAEKEQMIWTSLLGDIAVEHIPGQVVLRLPAYAAATWLLNTV